MNAPKGNALASLCVNYPVCRRARRKQRGFAYELVKKVESHICPFGRAYECVTGRKSHEPVPTLRWRVEQPLSSNAH